PTALPCPRRPADFRRADHQDRHHQLPPRLLPRGPPPQLDCFPPRPSRSTLNPVRPATAAFLTALAVLSVAGCTRTTTTPSTTPSTLTSPRTPATTRHTTQQTSPATSYSSPAAICPKRLASDEFRGQAPTDVQLWGLLFARYPITRAALTKIAWRM